MKLLIFVLISGALIVLVEVAKRKLSLQPKLTRKITHVGATVIAALSPLFLDKTPIVVVCILFAVMIFFCRKMDFLSSIHGIERASFGDVFLPLGEALAAIVFLPHDVTAFQYGVLVMGISDALAGFVGEHFAKYRIHFLGLTKSAEGSLAFFVSALLLAALFSPVLGYQLIVIAALLTLAESLGFYGSDNLILPILGGYLYQLYV